MPLRKTVVKARKLRRIMTPPEVKLCAIFLERPADLRFRRQHPIGPFVLDFYCPSAKLAIEVDGMAHDMGDNPERDVARDAWLAEQGMATLRISAVDILQSIDAVIRLIVGRCATPLHRPSDDPPPHPADGED